MLFAMVAFFGVIFAVNLTMAVIAGRSWTGLVVKNSYVASQEFNGELAKARAQKAHGWTTHLTYRESVLSFEIAGADGAPVNNAIVHARIGRPAYEKEDYTVEFARQGRGVYISRDPLKPGLWMLTIEADDGDFHYRRDARLYVNAAGKGTLQ